MRTWIRVVLAAAAVLGLAYAGWSQRDAIGAFDWSIDRRQLALSIALFAVAPLLQALTFAIGLRRVGADGPARGLVRVWARSFLLRYEPSGAVGFVYRVTARERMGRLDRAGADRHPLRAARRGRRRGGRRDGGLRGRRHRSAGDLDRPVRGCAPRRGRRAVEDRRALAARSPSRAQDRGRGAAAGAHARADDRPRRGRVGGHRP